ncbi:MAG TPA: hypothetical protein VJ717_11800 [Gemmatimonadaceae bacterium]|nr:hypothetical protein [Gemmatimonadaceae bacterium]
MPNDASWHTEAATFGAYLGARELPAEVAERYQMAVQDWRSVGFDRFDDWLLHFAAGHRFQTSLADAYSRLARPYGDLRRRLTLMLALLENHGTTHAPYDRAEPSGAARAWLALALSAAGWGLRTLLATAICMPAHVLLSRGRPRRA